MYSQYILQLSRPNFHLLFNSQKGISNTNIFENKILLGTYLNRQVLQLLEGFVLGVFCVWRMGNILWKKDLAAFNTLLQLYFDNTLHLILSLSFSEHVPRLISLYHTSLLFDHTAN